MPDTEPQSWLALAGVVALFVQQAINRWLAMRERRRNGVVPKVVPEQERGALGPNGSKAMTDRMDRIEREGMNGRHAIHRRIDTLVAELGEVKVLVGRLDERSQGG